MTIAKSSNDIVKNPIAESLTLASRRFRFLHTMKSLSADLLKQMPVINPATDAAETPGSSA